MVTVDNVGKGPMCDDGKELNMSYPARYHWTPKENMRPLGDEGEE